jgi:hypothetical protein
MSATTTRRKRVKDSRRAPFVWFSKEAFEQYAAEVGPRAWTVYCALCYHASAGARKCWPSLARLGELVGASWRRVHEALRRLVAAGLVRIVPRRGHSSMYEVTDPPAHPCRKRHTHPCRKRHTHPCRKRHTEQDPVEQESIEQVCVCAHTRPEQSSPEEGLKELWLSLLANRSPRALTAAVEVEGFAAELLRRGWTADELRRSLADPGRPRDEWPREWFARLKAAGRPRGQGARARAGPDEYEKLRAQPPPRRRLSEIVREQKGATP